VGILINLVGRSIEWIVKIVIVLIK
jgi:hypothetical protein